LCRLRLDDVQSVLQADAPALQSSLTQRQTDLSTVNSSGWQTVPSGRGNRATAVAASGNVLQHWVAGDPVSDWHFRQQVLQLQQETALKQQMQEEGLIDENGRPWFEWPMGIMGAPLWAAGKLVRRLCQANTLRASAPRQLLPVVTAGLFHGWEEIRQDANMLSS
jgi:hypothetical protein